MAVYETRTSDGNILAWLSICVVDSFVFRNKSRCFVVKTFAAGHHHHIETTEKLHSIHMLMQMLLWTKFEAYVYGCRWEETAAMATSKRENCLFETRSTQNEQILGQQIKTMHENENRILCQIRFTCTTNPYVTRLFDNKNKSKKMKQNPVCRSTANC